MNSVEKKYEPLLIDQLSESDRLSLLNEYAWELSRFDTFKALSLANQALDISKKSDNLNQTAKALVTKAQCYWLFGDYTQAIENLDEGLQYYFDANDQKGIAEIYNLFGAIYSRMGKLDTAEQYFEDALRIRRKINDQEGIVRSLNSLGDSKMKRGRFKEALLLFYETLTMDGITKMYEGIVKYNIAEVNYHLGNYEEAYAYIDQCIKINEEIDFSLIDTYCGSLSGKIETKKGNYDGAIFSYTKALKASKDIKNDEQIFTILKDLSELYEKLGDTKSAYKYFKEYHNYKEQALSKELNERLKALEVHVKVDKAKMETELERQKNCELQEAYATIETKQKLISEQNRQINYSIRYAKRIQEAIFPSDAYIKNLFPNSFVLYLPKQELSGDFYWASVAFNNDKHKLLMAALVDCTGHGIPGALLSIIANNYLRICEREHTINSAAEALDFINQGVSFTLRQEEAKDHIRDGMDMSFITINPTTMELEFAGAKNSIYLVRKGKLEIYKGDRHPIGAFIDEELKKFTSHKIPLLENDTIYLFTDGYADQFGGENDKKFTLGKFRKLISEISHLDMIDQHKILYAKFQEWKNKNEQTDDICVMGIRISDFT